MLPRRHRFDERFVDIYSQTEDGRYHVDCGRWHETEPVSPANTSSR